MAKYKIDAPSLHPTGASIEVVADNIEWSDGYVKFTRQNKAIVKAIQYGYVLSISLVED